MDLIDAGSRSAAANRCGEHASPGRGLARSALDLMSGSDAAAKEFVWALPDKVRELVPSRFKILSDLAHAQMMHDTGKFMAFKVPEQLVPLEISRFRTLIDALFENRVSDVQQLVGACSLEEAYVLFSASVRIREAHRLHPVVSGVLWDARKPQLPPELG